MSPDATRPTGGQLVEEGGLGDRASLRGARRRYLDGPPRPEGVAHWPVEWRALLTQWLRGGAAQRRIPTLLRGLDGPQLAAAQALLDALLHGGWIELEETHARGGIWQPRQLRFRDADSLREALGLARRDQQLATQQDIATRRFDSPAAALLHAALLEQAVSLRPRRIDLVEAVERWDSDDRSGTRRDFELLARGATKSLTTAEWEWLQQSLDLDALRIGGHTPGLWLRARCRLRYADGLLDLGVLTEPLALTPDTLRALLAVEHAPHRWQVVENRTSFERLARSASTETAVLWVPGHPPGWWRRAVGHLLDLAPAPAEIACDPDPAGIAIACETGALWTAHGLDWSPLGMDPSSLDRLPATQPLTDWDRALLARLGDRPLPAQLAALRDALLARGIKGEQEGLL